MYINQFDSYKILVEGAREAFKKAKKKTLAFYKNNPPKEVLQYKKEDLAFMEGFDEMISSLEKLLRKRNREQLNTDLIEFLYFIHHLTFDGKVLFQTRFAFEYIQEAVHFLGDQRLKETAKKIASHQKSPAKKGKKQKAA